MKNALQKAMILATVLFTGSGAYAMDSVDDKSRTGIPKPALTNVSNIVNKNIEIESGCFSAPSWMRTLGQLMGVLRKEITTLEADLIAAQGVVDTIRKDADKFRKVADEVLPEIAGLATLVGGPTGTAVVVAFEQGVDEADNAVDKVDDDVDGFARQDQATITNNASAAVVMGS